MSVLPPLPLLPAPPPGPPRRARAAVVAAVAAAVLWAHTLLLQGLWPALPDRWGRGDASPPALRLAPRPGPLTVYTLPAPAALPAKPPPEPLPTEPSGAPPPAVRPAAPARPMTAAAASPATGPGSAAAAGPTALAMAPARADALPTADAHLDHAPMDAAPERPPPVYPTRLPPPLRLQYTLQYNGQAGEATLAWRHDGRFYRLDLEGRGPALPLVQQASEGGFDAAGVAPERFADRRGGGRWRHAQFRREQSQVLFGSRPAPLPAWPGVQDRLSWLAQMAAIRAATPDAAAPRSTLSLFVVDARGAAGLWHFQPLGDVQLPTALGPIPTELWRREPPSPEGLRVEAWLDPARGHWPAQLRFTAVRSGDVFEITLREEPGPP